MITYAIWIYFNKTVNKQHIYNINSRYIEKNLLHYTYLLYIFIS